MAITASELIVLDGKIYHLRLEKGQLAPYVFVVGDPERAHDVANKFDKIIHRIGNREFQTITGEYHGMPVSVIGTGIGTDNNEITFVEAYAIREFDLEQRIREEGIQPLTVIRLGTSGGPQASIPPGTLAIARYAVGLDNTGLFYDNPKVDETILRIERSAHNILTRATPKNARFRGRIFPYASKADPEVIEALIRNARDNYTVGITASASGFYGPQGREIPGLPITVPRLQEHMARLHVPGEGMLTLNGTQKSRDLRVVNFEMETSFLYHIGALAGYRMGTICAVIANRPKGTFLNDYHPAVERCITVGLEAMHDLYRKDLDTKK
ncbi:MAG: nucleoside phosphorylase [Candidatus Woesearchaeota archaeon]|jgi:uridine phosphorylase